MQSRLNIFTNYPTKYELLAREYSEKIISQIKTEKHGNNIVNLPCVHIGTLLGGESGAAEKFEQLVK